MARRRAAVALHGACAGDHLRGDSADEVSSAPWGAPARVGDDEDFTLEVRIPAGMDRDVVLNVCLQQALELEQRFGFVILPRVKAA